MKSIFSKYLSPEKWLIRENKWACPEELNVNESVLTLGNGYVGSRGIYEEIPEGTEPGTYIAGVFDKAGAMVAELVNVPNPIDFRIIVEGEKLDITRMDVLEHERVLDLRKGILVRRTVFMDTKKRRFLYESMRFFSLFDTHVGCMQVYFKSLDREAKIIIQDAIDDSVTNAGSILEGRKRHTQVVDVSSTGELTYMCVKTYTRKIRIAYTSCLAVARGRGQGMPTLNKIFNMSIDKGETLRFTKIFTIYTSRHISQRRIKAIALRDARKAAHMGFEELLGRNTEAWRKRWAAADILIKGDEDVEKALRFNIYHMIISGKEADEDVSIGARTLSGEGYRGHVFWDTEMFLLPFYIYTRPDIARNLLMYRYNRLNPAREIAAKQGYRGTLFPWESADSGREVTPPYAKNLDGTIIEIKTMDYEHHIVADVAYGVWHYHEASKDTGFMLRAGLEIMFETARFWASRVTYNKKKKVYEIKRAMGPDEFHETVDNSAYVNIMASWNLEKAHEYYEHFSKTKGFYLRRVSRKISLSPGEVKKWKEIAGRIKVTHSKTKKIIEQFDGYLRKRDIIIKQFDKFFMPILPRNVKIRDMSKTQLVKQADVVMLLYLFPEMFSKEEAKRNYTYYIARTLHKSSLSPSIHSIVGNEVGDTARGYILFLFSLYADLKNTHRNTSEGIHAASLGGTWQACIMGFGGFRIMSGMPSFEPRLPVHWKEMSFSIKWRSRNLAIRVKDTSLEVTVFSRKKGNQLIKYFDSVYKIPFNKKITISRKR
ncbi:MAG: glycoside hydrolase family 65 protein [Candidatus Omnitrophica bacterium]|nr:glycoside hydrolase family 65 protein [Candidatus Omnitrophota bacterium]